MNETIKKLKGISCILSMMSYNEHSDFEFQTEAFDVLYLTLNQCIKELEEITKT